MPARSPRVFAEVRCRLGVMKDELRRRGEVASGRVAGYETSGRCASAKCERAVCKWRRKPTNQSRDVDSRDTGVLGVPMSGWILYFNMKYTASRKRDATATPARGRGRWVSQWKPRVETTSMMPRLRSLPVSFFRIPHPSNWAKPFRQVFSQKLQAD